MKIADAKHYFELDVIKKCYIVRDPLTPGNWLLVIELTNGDSKTLQTALGKDRSFSSLDTIAAQMEGMFGNFSSFTVSF